jgi:hypothetical protein
VGYLLLVRPMNLVAVAAPSSPGLILPFVCTSRLRDQTGARSGSLADGYVGGRDGPTEASLFTRITAGASKNTLHRHRTSGGARSARTLAVVAGVSQGTHLSSALRVIRDSRQLPKESPLSHTIRLSPTKLFTHVRSSAFSNALTHR